MTRRNKKAMIRRSDIHAGQEHGRKKAHVHTAA
jgi:hypothetical protein